MNPYMSSLCLLSCIEGKLASQLEIDFFVWMVVGCYNFLYGYLFLVWCILNVNAIFCFLCVDWNYDVSNWISYAFVLYRSAYGGDASFLFYDISVLIELYRGEISQGWVNTVSSSPRVQHWIYKDEKEVLILDNFFHSFVSSSLMVF